MNMIMEWNDILLICINLRRSDGHGVWQKYQNCHLITDMTECNSV